MRLLLLFIVLWNQKYQSLPIANLKKKEGINSKSRSLSSQYFSMEISKQPLFTILHFNDVYDIQPTKGLGGIANFYEQLKTLRQKHKNSILLFSGDCFSPSYLSNAYKGQQMVQALNYLKIDAACYGNHQFDFGRIIFNQLTDPKFCNFEWLLGNIIDLQTNVKDGKPQKLRNGKDKKTIFINGHKIGIFGVASKEWQSIITGQYEKNIQCEDYVKYSKLMCQELKKEQCDFIIALTHMSKEDDHILAQQCPGIDIILGGHDHNVQNDGCVEKIPVLKSGPNFYTIGVVEVFKKSHEQKKKQQKKIKQNTQNTYNQILKNLSGRRFNFDISIIDVPNNPNKELQEFVNNKMKIDKTRQIIGRTLVELDMTQCRCKETGYGNFLADLTRAFFGCDVAAINSGMSRFKQLGPGNLTNLDIINNTLNDYLYVVEVTGQIILKMLKNSISKLPEKNGRFLFVSGIKFTYNLKKDHQITNVMVGRQPLDEKKIYKLASRGQIFKGLDQYTMFQGIKPIKQTPQTTMVGLVLNFFHSAINYKNNHLQKQNSIETRVQRVGLARQTSIESDRPIIPFQRRVLATQRMKKLVHNAQYENHRYYYHIKPYIDGRIKEQ